MPLPKPEPGEDRGDFIDRCMADDVMRLEFPEDDQRFRVCERQFENREESDMNTLNLYGVIGDEFDGLDVPTVSRWLEDKEGDITVRINSGGGFVDQGLAIHNLLREHPGRVTVHIDAVAASIAGLIAMAGDETIISSNGLFMLHNPWGAAMGDANEMRHNADVLDKMRDAMAQSYRRKTGLSYEEIVIMMDDETWLTADEAKRWGFCDTVTDPVEAAAFHGLDLSMLASVPDTLQNVSRPAGKAAQNRQFVQVASIRKVIEGSDMGTKGNQNNGQNGAGDLNTGGNMPNAGSGAGGNANAASQGGPTGGGGGVDVEAVKQQALDEERQRRSAVRDAFGERFAREYPEVLAKCLDDVTCNADQARRALLQEMGKGVEPVSGASSVSLVQDEADKFRAAAVDGALARVGVKQPEQGNEFVGFGLLDHARASLRRSGFNTDRMSKSELAAKAITHTTSDFPNIFEDVLHKTLLAAYGEAEHVWPQIADVTDLADFRAHNRYRPGSFGRLSELNEAGEIPHATLPDAEKESVQAVERGMIVTLSYAMVVNDDMGAFADIARALGRAAGRSIEHDVLNLLEGDGPTMSTGHNLFDSSNHGNVATDAGDPSVARLGHHRKLHRQQKTPGGNAYADIRPEIVLTPLAQEDAAWEIVNSTAVPDGEHSAVANREYNRWLVLSSPVLDDISSSQWYTLSRPAIAPAFAVGFLNGQREPQVDMEDAFESRGIRYRVTHDYGVAAVDYRAIVRNDG